MLRMYSFLTRCKQCIKIRCQHKTIVIDKENTNKTDIYVTLIKWRYWKWCWQLTHHLVCSIPTKRYIRGEIKIIRYWLFVNIYTPAHRGGWPWFRLETHSKLWPLFSHWPHNYHLGVKTSPQPSPSNCWLEVPKQRSPRTLSSTIT